MERAGSLARILLLPLSWSASALAATDSAFAARNVPTDSGHAQVLSATQVGSPEPPPRGRPSASWFAGVGAPVFPQRDRFQLELARRVVTDSLVVDQPWDGSQLGFSTGLEAGYQYGWLRPAVGLEWSFWDSRSVHRSLRNQTSIERTWRLDQLVGLVGLDALIAPALLKVNGAQAPFVGFRYAQGVGRLEGMGRAWATGNGLQMHLGADVTSLGPLVVAGRLGWNALSFTSSSEWNRVLYGQDTPGDVSWNGSGIWIRLDLRMGPTAKTDTVRTLPPVRARSESDSTAPKSDSLVP